MSAEGHARRAMALKAREKRVWRCFLLLKTVLLVIIFALLAIAVWRFLRVAKSA